MTVDRSDFYFEAANSLNLRNPEDSTRPLACHPVGRSGGVRLVIRNLRKLDREPSRTLDREQSERLAGAHGFRQLRGGVVMATLTDNDSREFTVTRTPQVESAGYPCLFAVTLDGPRRSGSPRAACNPSNGRSAAHCATRRRPTMRVDDIQGHHIKSRRATGSSTAMGTPVADPGVRPAIRRLTDRYPALCLLALTLAGLGVTVRALAWILSHDGCSHPVGAVVAVLALAGCGVFAFAPVLMLMASQVGWLFPEDSQRE